MDYDSSSPVTVKPAKEVASDSLQNPSDPDATYDGHKGQGYQVWVMETYTESEDEDQKKLTPNLITYVEVQTACQSDANAVMPALEETLESGLAPEKLLADSLYGSDANVQEAAEIGVELIAPAMKGNQKKEIDLTAFEFDQTGRITHCPQDHSPERVKHKKKHDKFSACFPLLQCGRCPLTDQCLSYRHFFFYFCLFQRAIYRLFAGIDVGIDRYLVATKCHRRFFA